MRGWVDRNFGHVFEGACIFRNLPSVPSFVYPCTHLLQSPKELAQGHAIAAFGFGCIHGFVGPLGQRSDVIPFLELGDAAAE